MKNIKYIVVGVSYIVLSISFGFIITLTLLYLPTGFKSRVILLEIVKELNFIYLYVIINFLFSVLIGILIIANKEITSKLFIIISVLMISLIVLDFIPIIVNLMHYFSTRATDYPWTVVLLVFHTYLFFYFKKVYYGQE